MPISKVYKHADTYDTTCKICDKNEIEDESHCLYIYPVFKEDRNNFPKSITENFQVCINLLKHERIKKTSRICNNNHSKISVIIIGL